MKRAFNILMADDDPDDCLLVKDALAENRLTVSLNIVANGRDLLDYLYRQGKYRTEETAHQPDLIFLDLNMPGKDGREALKQIKADTELKLIPIVILTTSKAKEDVLESYGLGANSFITKPASFKSLCKVLKTVVTYWFDTVKLPASSLSVLALGLLP
jgi:CheY-like chemotaxis protein